MTDIDRSTLADVAEALSALDLSEICTLTIETNGATGGVDVIAVGVPNGDGIDSLIFVTRKLSVTMSGTSVERVE